MRVASAGWMCFVVASLVATVQGIAAGSSPPAAGVGLKNPLLALGLNAIASYSTEQPFLDLMHSARAWFGTGRTFQTIDAATVVASGVLDAHGWPTAIPKSGDTQALKTYWDGRSFVHNLKYVFTYRGSGKVRVESFGGKVNIFSAEVGRIVFSVTGGDSAALALNITSTDPNRTGDYVRDISIVPEKYEALAKSGEIFNPDWLSVVGDARELRFMDWMLTNNSNQVDWSDRPQVGDYTWTLKGVPVEVMVQLANQTGAEPWFNLPAKASDDYVTQFATYVRDHLNPDLVAHVEWSNEVWNWGFAQATWAQQQAQALWGADATNLDYQAMRATQIGAIWDQMFGPDAKLRVDNVLGIQTADGGTWWLKRMLPGQVWKAHDPGHFIDPTSVIDSVAVTTYFGYNTLANAALRDQLLDVVKTMSFEAAADWLAAQLRDPNYAGSIPKIATVWNSARSLTETYRLHLVAYEGGQHLAQGYNASGMSADDAKVLNAFILAFVRSPQMGALYGTLWDEWANVADGPFAQYYDVGSNSGTGAWGLYDRLGDRTPRSDLIEQRNQTAEGWFGDGGGSRYLQGIIRIAGNSGETVTGTDKQDFLIGGDGNDTFTPGKGDDAVSGGKGNDTVVLAGSRESYSVTRQDGGYRLVGPDGSKRLLDIEDVAFQGTQPQPIASLVH